MSLQRWLGMYTQATSERRQDRHIQQRISGVALAAIALALLVGVLSGGSASAQPTFTNVTDIINGRRHLLRTDDLVVAYQAGNVVLGNLLLTDASQITSNTPSSLNLQPGCGSTPTVIAARMFDTPCDVAVSAELNGTTLLWSYDARPNDGSPVQFSGELDLSVLLQFEALPFLYSAAADFTGDGLDEILFILSSDGGAVAFVATAADTTNPNRGLTFFVPTEDNIGAALDPVFAPLPIAIDTSTGSPRIFMLRAGIRSNDCTTAGGLFELGGLGINYFTMDPQRLTLTNPQFFTKLLQIYTSCR